MMIMRNLRGKKYFLNHLLYARDYFKQFIEFLFHLILIVTL